MSGFTVSLVHVSFQREDLPVVVRESSCDTAGYRPIGSLVKAATDAGMQLNVFRAAEFDGNMEVNPVFANYIDPVDRDSAILAALKRGKTAQAEFQRLRREAIDKRRSLQEAEIERVAERLQRRRNAQARSSGSEAVPPSAE